MSEKEGRTWPVRKPPQRDASSCRTQRELSALSFCKYGFPACRQTRLRQRLITSKFNCAASLLSLRAIRSQTKGKINGGGKEKGTTDPKSKGDPNIAARNHYGHIITRVCVSALYKDERTSALAASDAALESYEEEVNVGLSFADFGPFRILKNKVLLQTADDGDGQ